VSPPSVGGGAFVDTGGWVERAGSSRVTWHGNWGGDFASNPAPASTHGGGGGLEGRVEWLGSDLEMREKSARSGRMPNIKCCPQGAIS